MKNTNATVRWTVADTSLQTGGYNNGIRQSEALEYIGSRLKMLHLNDNYGSDDIHLAPFMGTID